MNKILSAPIAAVLAMGAVETVQATPTPTQQQAPTSKDATVIDATPKIIIRKNLPFGGGEQLFYNNGISPKEYGLNHVRRGTHKRTNKK